MKEKMYMRKALSIPAVVLMCLLGVFLLGQGSVFADEINEEEPNDDGYTANYIDFGDSCHGITDVNGGCDCFFFTPEHSRKARLYIQDDDPQATVHAAVYEGNTLIDEFDSRLESFEEKKISFDVRKGKDYYIQITDNESFDDPELAAAYNFSLVYEIKKTGISRLTAGKGAFTVRWKKVKEADFYQVVYTTQANYKEFGWNGAPIKKVSKKKLETAVKKLKKKKAYCAAVRAVKKIDRKYFYSDFCKAKTFKTK